MGNLKGWLRTHPLAVGALALACGMVGLALPPVVGGVMGEGLHELALAAVMGVVIALVGGPQAVRPSAAGMAFSLRTSTYLLVIVSLPLVLTMALMPVMRGELDALGLGAAAQGPSPLMWLAALALALVLALGVALFEEALFRGIVLSALLERLGRTRVGLAGAVLVASLVFGLMHVLPALLGVTSASVSTLVVLLLRLVITTVDGLLFSALYLRTHNLWCAVLVHGVHDALLFVPLLAIGMAIAGGEGNVAGTMGTLTELEGLSFAGGAAGASAVSPLLLALGIAVMVVVVVGAYAPVAFVAWRQLGMVEAGEGSVFSARWEPRLPPSVTGAASSSSPRPPTPPGMP